MLIGEGPGWHEDQQGRPFVGNAGAFLNQLLQQAGLERADVFITNVVKCRPPGNRDPLPDEIAACAPYLERQIAAINPEIIVTLGRFSKIHGEPRKFGNRTIVPMYHPAAALHQSGLRAIIEEDFARLPKILAQVDRLRLTEASRAAPPPEQTSMF
jgi:DNA polymerase